MYIFDACFRIDTKLSLLWDMSLANACVQAIRHFLHCHFISFAYNAAITAKVVGAGGVT